MQSLLIANRGEIAVRVIRAARELGLRSIAVYSELDRDALHVELADEAWNIGPAPAGESYLNQTRILAVAAEAGADAVHPGYGFLAENATFARAVTEAGLIWVGPPPDAIEIMGDKIASRRAAAEAGVQSIPGTSEPARDVSVVTDFARDHGLPIAIKAAHGGGGKGLKVVREAEEIEAAYESARREADAWFGSSEVYVERFLERARHIEAQVLLDTHGTAVFVGERDCTVQRRHQKLIEETPAMNLDPKVRDAIGEASLTVARAAGYVNAGTVEFLVDTDQAFYFLEMNTRIQVEHAITEMTTGTDLVKEQIGIAAGLPVSFTTTPAASGHAIEFRINAEDAGRGFLPTPGTIVEYQQPSGLGIRVDSGVGAGSTISQYYDNLIAKLVVWGRDRDEAIARGRVALESFRITGVETTIPAHVMIIDTTSFRDGTYDTNLVADEVDLSGLPQSTAPALPEEEEVQERSMTVEVGGKRYVVKFWAPVLAAAGSSDQRAAPRRRPPKLSRQRPSAEGAGVVTAPMQGTIVKVYKQAGALVDEGEPVAVLEAMKMENELKAPVGGEIVDLRVQAGDTVGSGAVLMIIR